MVEPETCDLNCCDFGLRDWAITTSLKSRGWNRLDGLDGLDDSMDSMDSMTRWTRWTRWTDDVMMIESRVGPDCTRVGWWRRWVGVCTVTMSRWGGLRRRWWWRRGTRSLVLGRWWRWWSSWRRRSGRLSSRSHIRKSWKSMRSSLGGIGGSRVRGWWWRGWRGCRVGVGRGRGCTGWWWRATRWRDEVVVGESRRY